MSGPDTSDETAIRERARRAAIAGAFGAGFAGFGFGCFIVAAMLPSLRFAAGCFVCVVISVYCFCQEATLKSGPSE